MNDETLDALLKLLNKNKIVKHKEMQTINQFENLYKIINYFEPQNIEYDELIENPELRLRFLANSINIVIDNKEIDSDTREIIFNMFSSLYNYFYENTGLQDLEIPKQFKEKMFITSDNGKENLKKDLLIPSPTNIIFLLTLIRENRRIYNEDFKGLNLSQKITEGLHKNITEILSIEEKDVSHMLGVNNEAHHLFDFFRKNYIDNQILLILKSIGIKDIKDVNDEKAKSFNKIFMKKFGLPYNKSNYQLLIGLRYSSIEKMFASKEITKSQYEKLKKSYDEASKSSAIDFYSSESTARLLANECVKNSDFIYEYVRKNIIAKKLSNKNDRFLLLETFAKDEILNNEKIIKLNEEKQMIGLSELSKQDKKNAKIKIDEEIKRIEETEIFSQPKYQNFINKILDFNQNSNNKEIRVLIDKYIDVFGNTLKKNNEFQKKFKYKFGYEYPLIDYYEILTKNISFYNFSLMKNLNSIIVDFDDPKKKNNSEREPDVFLVSFAKKKIDKLKNKISKKIEEEQTKLHIRVMSDNTDTTDEYIAALRSLYCFPQDDRYYFEDTFTSKLKNKRDNEIIHYVEDHNETKSNDIFSLMGFFTPNHEAQRISELQENPNKSIYHRHNFKTNITSNFHKYLTHFKKFGHEYPIGVIWDEDPIKKKKRILRINNTGPGGLKKYIELFNEYQYNLKLGYSESEEYEKYLIKSISGIIVGHKKINEAKIKMLKYYKDNYLYDKEDILKYDLIIQKEEIYLEKFNMYCEKTKEYFKEYKELFSKLNEKIQTQHEQSTKRKNKTT